MKLIIVGLGQTGTLLVNALAGEQYDITVIDRNRDLVDYVTDRYNVNGITGSGASTETLLAAGADTADAVIALTHVDEINLLSCMQAKALGTARSAARIMSPDFVREWRSLKEQYKIDYLVRPKIDIADVIRDNIGLPGFMKLEGYFGNDIRLVDMNILKGNPLIGRKLCEIRQSLDLEMLVIAAIRNDKLYIPGGDFAVMEGDTVGLVVPQAKIHETLAALGIIKKETRRIVIVGGGFSGEYLLDLMKDRAGSITVLEQDIVRCRELAEKYPGIRVSYSGGEILDVLEEEKVSSADALISLTDHDETNLVISMYAWSCGIPSVITRIDKPEHLKLLHRVNIDITVSLTEQTVLKMVRFIRNSEMGGELSAIGKFYYIAENRAEVMEFTATEEFPSLGITLADTEFRLRKDVLVTAVLRKGELIIPCGSTCIEAGDRVIITSSRENKIRKLNDILR